jgi:hypothetical protein
MDKISAWGDLDKRSAPFDYIYISSMRTERVKPAEIEWRSITKERRPLSGDVLFDKGIPHPARGERSADTGRRSIGVGLKTDC